MAGLRLNPAIDLLILGLAGCASGPEVSRSWSPPPSTPPQLLLVVLDGAGGYPSAYNAITEAVREQGLPIQIESVRWGHSHGRFIADQTDADFAFAAGQQLATQLQPLRDRYPSLPLVIVAHSAGTAPALACAEALPANSIERMIFMAPAVSNRYDLRRALKATRNGIDVFYSERDWFYLGIGIVLLGTTDGKRDVAAGRTGFVFPSPGTPEAAVYSKLHQYRWDPSLSWTGNTGQHNGAYRQVFLRTQVLPLILPPSQ